MCVFENEAEQVTVFVLSVLSHRDVAKRSTVFNFIVTHSVCIPFMDSYKRDDIKSDDTICCDKS